MKNSSVKETTYVGQAKFYKNNETVPTAVPMINVALSGDMDGGVTPGVTMIAGPSRHFKTLFGLIMVKAFLDKYPDGAVLFFNNEYGSPEAYFKGLDIDTSRVIETPFDDIEMLKQETIKQLDFLNGKEKVMIFIDSIGMVASRKELDDVREEKVVGDMTRAKQMKAYWRMVTPILKRKSVPLVAINHSYQTQEMYSKSVVSGGTGGVYAADNIWIIGRQQETGDVKTADGKKKKAVTGYSFIINVEKSRFVKEKSKIPVTVLLEGGLSKWSGLFDIALQEGYIVSPSKGYFATVNRLTGEVSEEKFRRSAVADSSTFWESFLKTTDFKEHVKKMFTLGTGPLLSTDTGADEDLGEDDDEDIADFL